MTYLAMEISLYLASAALIGIALGWSIWGLSRRRHAAKIRTEMTAAIEEERGIASGARDAIAKLKAKHSADIGAEKARAAKAIAESRQFLEVEKKGTQTVKAELSQLRQEMDEVINAEKASASNAIEDAMRNTENLTIALHEAELRENQTRAELEELRLMAGAEKLAAESARAELDRMREEMRMAIAAERETNAQSREAIDAIRTTLVQTFGEGAGIVDAVNIPSETAAFKADDQLSSIETDVQVFDDDPFDEIDDFNESINPTLMTEEIEGESSIAIDVQDVSGTSIHEMVSVDEEVEPIEASSQEDVEGQDAPTLIIGDQQAASNVETLKPVLLLQPLGEAEEEAASSDEPQTSPARPISLFDVRPDVVDDLTSISGIDQEIEQALNDVGCYQIDQLANFSEEDIDWLTQEIHGIPDLKTRMTKDDWLEQAKALRSEKQMAADSEKPRWWNRRRLR